jgi:hypothetical protein
VKAALKPLAEHFRKAAKQIKLGIH